MNIRTRMLILVVAVWLPAVAAFALLAGWSYGQAEESARTALLQLGEDLILATEGELARKTAIASTLAGSSVLARGDLDAFRREARAALKPWPREAMGVALVSRTHILFYSGLEGAATVPRPQDAPHATSEPLVAFTPAGPVTREPVVGVFAPVPGRDTNVILTTPAREFVGILQRATIPQGAIVSLADGRGVLMARTRDHDRWVGRAGSGPAVEMAMQGRSGFVRSTTLDGVASLTYVSRPNAYRWVAVVALPAAALQDAAFEVSWRLVAASAALLGIGGLAALVLARRIIGPLRTLHEAAARVGQGQVPAPLQTGLPEADAIGAALHQSASANRDATLALAHEVEQAVAQAREAQAKLFEGQKREAIGRLTGGIAHDFNNLLQTITVGLHAIERTLTEPASRRALQAAQRACGKAAELIRQMLTFGRSQPLAPRRVHLDDFVLKALELTTRAVGPRIELTTDIEPGLPPAWADTTELELALLNLIFNARDAMPQGGRIGIGVRRARPDEAMPDGLDRAALLCLQVQDNGSGMDEQTLARATEPFYTTKPVGSGSGLGLAQVQWFAQHSGGALVLRSAPGQGTTASIWLPVAAEATADETPQEPAPPAPRDSLHVLMVEDDVLVATVVQPALENAGHRVTLCRDASDAMQRLQSGEDHDVLFTDIVMPGPIDGGDLVRWCLEHRPSLPCVVATGYAGRSMQPEVGIVSKPYTIERVLDALAAAVARARGSASGPG